MIVKIPLGPVLFSLIVLGLGSSVARADDPFKDKLQPFMQAYCVKCHNKTLAEGELNLNKYTSATSVGQDFRQWEHVVTFLKEEKMPPKDETKRPAAKERDEFLAAIDKVFLAEARKLANDPGALTPRRLSNAEFNYTVRDLTGVDIRPASKFPVDPASGEGFSNTSEALTMSPALFKKYYAAAQEVADHALLTTTEIEFSPHTVVTFSDQQKYYEQQILRFYEQHKIGYETYLTAAYTYRHRPSAKRDATIEAWAAENKLSKKYLRSLWETLQDDPASNFFYLQWLRQRWNALPAPGKTTQIPSQEVAQQIRVLANDIQRLSTALCMPESEAIISNAGNAPVPHIDRRKKTAASRDKFNPNLVQTSQRVHLEIKANADKSAAKLIISVSKPASETGEGYVVLSQMNFSNSQPNNYNPKDNIKKNISLRTLLMNHAPDRLKELSLGAHPVEKTSDPECLVLKVPSTIEIDLPKDALKDNRVARFYAEAALDRKNSKVGMVRVAVRNQNSKGEELSDGVLLIAPEHASSKQYTDAAAKFCKLFPRRFYYVDDTRGVSAGFHLIEGFFRDDQPMYNSVLSDEEKREIDRLWTELYFATRICEKMLHGFVFFEREERGFLKHPDFNSIREEDPFLASDETLNKFEQIYLKRSNVNLTGNALAGHPIHEFFEDIRQGVKLRATQLKQAEPAYLRNLQEFAQKAYRRPLTIEETKQILDFYHSVAKQEEFGMEQAVRASITRILVSPHFCYHLDLPPAGKTIEPVPDLAMASRLSYFLWSSMPDKELIDLAAQGKLNNETALKTQMQRMLKDPKVSGFALEFFGQWLQYRDFLQQESVNRQVFPEFDDLLKQSMFEEPTRLATWLIQNDLPVTNILQSDTTFVNRRLARHYGLPFSGKDDTTWEKADGMLKLGRGGYLGMSVFLTKNSQPQRTSPVKRGFWVVHKLMGEHIPAPPANVAVLPAKETDTKGKSIRELLALHTENATCARCHQRFDPVGLSMEGFDAIGKSRTKDLAGRPIDNVVHLPTGGESRGIPEFSKYLATKRKDEFTKTMCRKFLGFALGRSLELSDLVLLEKMQAELEKNDYRFSTLFETVVMSPQFRNQRGRDFVPANLKNDPGEKP
jgi:hypothetical protein